jgi:ABC-type lipoprotein release transport system permease subunit
VEVVLIDLKMAWRNIWRNPRRTLLTMLAIAFACVLLVFMLSFQFGSYDTMIDSSVKINTGHLQIQARDYRKDHDIRKVIPDPQPILQIIDRIPQIMAATTRASAFAMASSASRTYGVMVVGIQPRSEARVSTLGQIITQGTYLTAQPDDQDFYGALVGRLLAHNLRLSVGDEVTLLGQGRDGSVAAAVVKVRGIYSSGMEELDRNAMQIPLAAFQEIFSMQGAVHEIVVVGHALSQVPRLKADLQQRLGGLKDEPPLVVLDWDELLPGLRQAISMDLVSGAIFYLILIMVVAFSILNTFLMAILERTHEFGVMMAMGTRSGRLTRLVMAESAGMTLIGVAVGVLAGVLLTGYFQVHGIDISGSSELLRQYGIPSRIYPRLSLLSITIGPAAVLTITLFAALYPALRIRRLRPVEALAYL